MTHSLEKLNVTKKQKTAMAEQRSTTFMVEPEKLVIVGFDTHHKKGEHPLWQERALGPVDEALAQNIAANGFTSVIQVRVDGAVYEVVAGRRRVKAARRANELRAERGEVALKIEVKVVRGQDLNLVSMMIAENALREDVPPMQMVEDVQHFINLGASEEMAAQACGKTVPQLRQFLRLLDLDSRVQAAVRENKLAVSAAIRLAALGREEQVQELERIKSGDSGATVADVDAVVRAKKQGSQEVTKAPGKRLINKLLAHEDAERVFGDADAIKVLRWSLGELPARNIAGLVELIRKVSE